MNLSHYTALLLFEERAARLQDDAARARLAGTVAREGEPPRRRWSLRRRRQATPAKPFYSGGVAR